MSDIKQAAKWLEEGHTVARVVDGEILPDGYRNADSLSLDAQGFIVCSCHGQRVPFRPSALIADNWEIAKPMESR